MLIQRPHPDFPDTLDPLASATRDQLWAFAKANGLDFDHRTTPARTMELVLRERGLTNIPVPPMRLGSPNIPAEMMHPGQAAKSVNVDDELLAQYRQSIPKTAAPPAEAKPVAQMTIGELRKECGRRGIKMERTDNMGTLRDKLNVQAAS